MEHDVRNLSWLAAVFLLSACSQKDLLQRFSSPADQVTAKAYIDQLRSRDFDGIDKTIDPSIRSPTLHDTLAKMADLIPAGEPTSIKLVGAQVFRASGATTVNTTFEYDFNGTWLLANVAVQEKSGKKTIIGFNVNREAGSLQSRNHFDLSGKTPVQYALLIMAIMAVLFTLYSLIVCIRTKLPGRKWPWVLFIVVGFGKLAVNWTTGQWSIAPLSIQLFSAAAAAQLYGPWIVSVSLPVGAVVFLIYRRKLRALPAESRQPVEPNGPD